MLSTYQVSDDYISMLALLTHCLGCSKVARPPWLKDHCDLADPFSLVVNVHWEDNNHQDGFCHCPAQQPGAGLAGELSLFKEEGKKNSQFL